MVRFQKWKPKSAILERTVRRIATLVASAIFGSFPLAAAATNSSIVLPVEFDLGGFVADAERELPRHLESDWEAVGKTVVMPVAYRFQLTRSPIELEGRADRLTISTKIRYVVDVAVPAPSTRTGLAWRRVNGCQPAKPVTVALETRIDFAPDWRLRARSQPRLDMPEPCRLSAARELVNIDISEKVRAAFLDGLWRAARDFDKRLAAQAMLREVATRAWQGLQEPLPLGERAWLALHPSRVLVMRPVIHGRLVRTGVIVTGQPELLAALPPGGTALAALPSGVEPPFYPQPPPDLPPLELADPQEGFSLDWLTTLTWPELAAQVRSALVGEQIKVAGRRTVRIEDVFLRPDGGRAVVAADLSGGVKGRIELTGTPRFHAETRTLEFDDLEFTLATRSFLVRVADWFRHESTRQKLARMARVDVSQWLQATRGKLETALRAKFGEDLRLSGVLEIAEPSELAFDQELVKLNAHLTGTLTLRWEKPAPAN